MSAPAGALPFPLVEKGIRAGELPRATEAAGVPNPPGHCWDGIKQQNWEEFLSSEKQQPNPPLYRSFLCLFTPLPKSSGSLSWCWHSLPCPAPPLQKLICAGHDEG